MGAADEWCTAPVLNVNAATLECYIFFQVHWVMQFIHLGVKENVEVYLLTQMLFLKNKWKQLLNKKKLNEILQKDYGHKNAKMGYNYENR